MKNLKNLFQKKKKRADYISPTGAYIAAPNHFEGLIIQYISFKNSFRRGLIIVGILSFIKAYYLRKTDSSEES